MTSPAPQSFVHTGGLLKIGETGSLIDWSGQMTEISVEPSVDVGDKTNVLSGAVLPGDRDYSARLKGKCLQSVDAAGLIRWAWDNRGKELPFIYIPTRAGSAASSVNLKGRLIVDPLTIGGEVKKRNTSDLDFECVGMPTWGTGES